MARDSRIQKRPHISEDQSHIVKSLLSWIAEPSGQFITVGGYAGTGKTTVASILRKKLYEIYPEMIVSFACFTGKASQVLRGKLIEQGVLFSDDTVGTLHSLMYHPIINTNGQITGWTRTKEIEANLIIIDEASMVTHAIWDDILSYNVPIIAIGDHGQLPPVGDTHSLMETPALRLKKIHRHMEGNPILEIATLARETGILPFQSFSSRVKKMNRTDTESLERMEDLFRSIDQETLVLCGRNKTRVTLNKHIRSLQGYESPHPQKGERVICVKNNYQTSCGPIYNGMVGIIQDIEPWKDHWYHAHIFFSDEERLYEGKISKHQFNADAYIEDVAGIHYKEIGDRFDFGYALTVHKAQGSQANRVILFEEPSTHWDQDLWKRWLYTAVTRAVNELYIFG